MRAAQSFAATTIALSDLIIIDEPERMQTAALELMRDIFDRTSRGVILICMPGMERRLARYPQLYSRVGFAHHYRPLTGDKLGFVLTRHWRRLGLELDEVDYTDAHAIASIARIARGNSRLLQRLFIQIGRILKSTTSAPSPTTSSAQPAPPSLPVPPSPGETPPQSDGGYPRKPIVSLTIPKLRIGRSAAFNTPTQRYIIFRNCYLALSNREVFRSTLHLNCNDEP